jgi:quercetin dioxygenase-like cupin family protein
MIIRNYQDVEAEPVPDLEGATIRWLISKPQGAPNFALRVIELQPGAGSPHHAHDWEHEMFILSGHGTAWKEGKEVPVREGDALFIPANEEHEIINRSDELLRFICLIPLQSDT